MLTTIYGTIYQILLSENFTTTYVFTNYKSEKHLNSRFAIVDVLSDKAIGKAAANDGTIYEEYELEVKISLYFKPNEVINTVQKFSDTILQRFYKNKNLNITGIFSKPIRYSSTYKCLKSEIVLTLSYLLEETA